LATSSKGSLLMHTGQEAVWVWEFVCMPWEKLLTEIEPWSLS
jgi:hypothetical protein